MHRLMQGNFFSNDCLEQLIGDGKIGLLYSDPPWDQGKITYFYRIAGVDNPPSIKDMIKRYVQIIEAINATAYIEMGERNMDYFLQELGKHDFTTNTFGIFYNAGRNRNWLIRASRHKCLSKIDCPPDSFQYLRKEKIIEKALSLDSVKGGTVLDFAIGEGMTLRACNNLKRTCYGLELSLKRLQSTIRYAQRKGLEFEVINERELA